ncbi:lipase family protein [Streptomyces sp. SCSIO ZS0520]|uniref:lipase family protein n=1 Tax=Streptomyces sp. SCSIO ZS0520 TaxID=2892996 RepID=UPI0021DA6519|nr:lipase family protein [Streptomyces sp. SCSIO ZS0520]
MRSSSARLLATAVVTSLTSLALVAAPAATAAPPAAPAVAAKAAAKDKDPFYRYDGSKPLSAYAPGDVLKTRTLTYHFAGIPTPVKAVQLLYRTTDAKGRPAANVTSVVRSIKGDSGKALSYQSFYDSLDPEHAPSRAIAGDVSLGGSIATIESLLLTPALLQGYNLVIPDTEGQEAHFAAGPEYGTNTLDSIRAATRSPETGMGSGTRFGLAGYSGGAIATNWAAALAPAYAPEVDKKLVGFTEGGILANPAHNLKYVGGSLSWGGIIPMAVLGIARSYEIDLKPYLNDYGVKLVAKLERASIINVFAQYPGLSWKKIAKPEYADPNSVPEYVTAVNKVNLGSAATPTVPGYIVQGNAGIGEGTFSNHPGIGRGDGVMVTGDVQALARQYCDTGNTAITYKQHNFLGHFGAAVPWMPTGLAWLNDRFEGKPAPSDCDRIPEGNSLEPQKPAPRS